MSSQHSSNQNRQNAPCHDGIPAIHGHNPLSQDSPQQSLNTSIAMSEYLAGSLPVKPNLEAVEDNDEPLRYLTSGEIAGLRHCIHCVRGVLENAYEALLAQSS
jgi:hypothetical protein